MSMNSKYTIGIDEAGRGPLAGPVSVGVAMVPFDFDWEQIPGVNDSKKLTEKKREVIFEIATQLKSEGKLTYAVEMVSAIEIDEIRIVASVTKAMYSAINSVVSDPVNCGIEYDAYTVKLDGGLKAPKEFTHQETIIKGDSKEKVIGLASIMAKVTRDRYMVRISAQPKFAPYMFATHKGYGTKAHRESIAQNGLSSEHRKSYCKNIILL
ncbi:MAG: ribonuclease HII [Acidimicrobiales bacterium]|jgi:ribonuclease HII